MRPASTSADDSCVSRRCCTRARRGRRARVVRWPSGSFGGRTRRRKSCALSRRDKGIGKHWSDCNFTTQIRVFHPQEKRILTRNIYLLLHSCSATFLIICIVVWDGIPKHEADDVYKLLIHKLNKFGLPTTRRCATNENRTCACQGETI